MHVIHIDEAFRVVSQLREDIEASKRHLEELEGSEEQYDSVITTIRNSMFSMIDAAVFITENTYASTTYATDQLGYEEETIFYVMEMLGLYRDEDGLHRSNHTLS